MRMLGVTGGIGMGKSACGDFLRAKGVPVVDTDDLAREVVQPGQPALAEIVQHFGKEILTVAGELDRRALAKIVFNSPSERAALEAILHPRIRQSWLATANTWKTAGHRLGAVIIPLLFETSAEKEVDQTICVACSHNTQLERLSKRGWSPDQICQRVAAQMPVASKMTRADFVIWSEGALAVTAAQLEKLLKRLTS